MPTVTKIIKVELEIRYFHPVLEPRFLTAFLSCQSHKERFWSSGPWDLTLTSEGQMIYKKGIDRSLNGRERGVVMLWNKGLEAFDSKLLKVEILKKRIPEEE